MTTLDWERCKDLFEWDGSLSDIHLPAATIEHWRVLYQFLCEHYELEYTVDGEPRALPTNLDDVLSVVEVASPSLRFHAGRMLFVFHTWSEDHMELDIDPREVTSQTDLDVLCGVLQGIGDTTGQRVWLTPEGGPDLPLISYDPSGGEFRRHM